MTNTSKEHSPEGAKAFIELIAKKIPDPIIIFIWFLVLAFLLTAFIGGLSFETVSADGTAIKHTIKDMTEAEHVRWFFDNALLKNWLGFGNGVMGVILIVMLGVGVSESSGLLTALIKKLGTKIHDRFLAPALIFLGIMSSIATDAGYLVLIPLAGMLYAGLGKNPLIGMAAAFAGVSAGFSANLIPATPVDVILGVNAKIFADAQSVPFTNAAGEALSPPTMHYYFIVASTFLLVALGAWVTKKFVEPKLSHSSFILPEQIDFSDFKVSDAEKKGLKASLVGLLVALAIVLALALGPLAPYVDSSGRTVTPYLNNVILLIALVFTIVGAFFGFATKKFKNLMDVVLAMVNQMNTMGYILVLTFFCYNFLGILGYSGLGTYITYLGASFLGALGLQEFPVLLVIGFVLITSVINIFVGGLTSKWMLLGPIFIPMLYQVNSQMTPDLVTAAYRVADSSTNIITPMMSYAGVILAFMRKYKPELTLGDMMVMMVPYSISFLVAWTALLVAFFSFGIPFGF
ncbi:AbgT family transporter [Pseudobacteriovorax antillogorgiicola]|uniref:Aminobenzoyl-glutamate transport protein n=1 Tax=Pseudobacteriovorax antillogorgiicola TaxID=1513793 RepID=A0A1Y6BKW5_9BACT|nr:AbgT family transporter [Pseudobacteriovorax antillogorgiicola]TCS54646.1 aminobenzoyl-glutamate transport protein [Pseudobacteriovorax antillogorgiicola]SMF16945.1 aminobenzoyl-glutamate transport protein [Pseudobacteriovorax antillogorgiicola]